MKCRSVRKSGPCDVIIVIIIVFNVLFVGGSGLCSEGEVMDAHTSFHLQQEHGRSRAHVQ